MAYWFLPVRINLLFRRNLLSVFFLKKRLGEGQCSNSTNHYVLMKKKCAIVAVADQEILKPGVMAPSRYSSWDQGVIVMSLHNYPKCFCSEEESRG